MTVNMINTKDKVRGCMYVIQIFHRSIGYFCCSAGGWHIHVLAGRKFCAKLQQAVRSNGKCWYFRASYGARKGQQNVQKFWILVWLHHYAINSKYRSWRQMFQYKGCSVLEGLFYLYIRPLKQLRTLSDHTFLSVVVVHLMPDIGPIIVRHLPWC